MPSKQEFLKGLSCHTPCVSAEPSETIKIFAVSASLRNLLMCFVVMYDTSDWATANKTIQISIRFLKILVICVDAEITARCASVFTAFFHLRLLESRPSFGFRIKIEPYKTQDKCAMKPRARAHHNHIADIVRLHAACLDNIAKRRHDTEVIL